MPDQAKRVRHTEHINIVWFSISDSSHRYFYLSSKIHILCYSFTSKALYYSWFLV